MSADEVVFWGNRRIDIQMVTNEVGIHLQDFISISREYIHVFSQEFD